MGNKPLSNNRIHIAYPIPAWRTTKPTWTQDKISDWVKNAGGKVLPKFDQQAQCTHLVVDEAKWRNKTMVVQQALEANENGAKIHIVSPDWLEESLSAQKKSRERGFSWEAREAAAEKAGKKLNRKKNSNGGGKSSKDEVSGEGEGEGDEGRPASRAPQALIGEVFTEATEPFVGERDRRILDAEAAGEERARREREEAEARAKEEAKRVELLRRKQRAELMKKSVKKGRGEHFYENYHVFKDGTGFAYDIMLTKVDTLTNTNERINLTIFETNKQPHTYATNYHYSGTNKNPLNNVLDAMNSNMTTATRTFRKAFREQTGVSWDDRIKAHNQRVRARQDREADPPGLLSTRRGENGDIKSSTRADEDAVPFEKRKFEYTPPLHSARGWLPDGSDEVPEVVRRMRGDPGNGRRDRTEQWMMSGDAPEEGPGEQNGVDAPIDLTDDGPKDQEAKMEESVGEEDWARLAGEPGADNDDGEHVGATPDNAENTDVQTFTDDNFLAGLNEWSTQDNLFDMGYLSGQQQPQFNFDQTHASFDAEQSAAEPNDFSAENGHDLSTDFINGEDIFGQGQDDANPITEDLNHPEPIASGNGEAQVQSPAFHEPEGVKSGDLSGLQFPYETQADQTQLAAMVGENLLNLDAQGNADGLAELGGVDGLQDDPACQVSSGGVGVGKRKRDGDDAKGAENAAKRFDSELEGGFEGETLAT